MRLIRLFYEPSQVFTELRDAGCVPALTACIALSLLSSAIFLNAVGPEAIARVAEVAGNPGIGGPALVLGFYLVKPILMVMGLLVTATVLWAVLRITKTGSSYRTVLAVCSYAAYAREAVKCLLTVVAVTYSHLFHTPLRSVVTDATVFLSGAGTNRLVYRLLSDLDGLTLGFLTLVTIGLWKTSHNLRLQKAAEVVSASWLTYCCAEICLVALRFV